METAAKKTGSLVRWLAVLSLVVLLAGAARAQTGSITGQVMAADTREPLAGAAVEVSGPALAAKKEAIADEKGRYAIEKVPEGTYVVKVTYVGYVAGVARKVSVTSKDPRTSQGTTVAISTGSRSLLTGRVRHAGLRGKWGWKVAGWCETHYIDMMPHNPLGPISTAAHVHFGAAVPNFAWLESREGEFSFDRELFPVQHQLRGTGFPLPQGPGLGVEFNEEMAREEFRFWEAPHLHRQDGSYTNW